MDEIIKPLPHEWYPFLCQFQCRQFIDYSDLEREWFQIGLVKWGTPELNAKFNQLFDGDLECTLGISGEEVDLRWAEFLARSGLKPTLVFFGIYERHRIFRHIHRHFSASPTDRYIDSIVHRVFGMLFEHALGSGRVQVVDEKRVSELFRLLDEDDDA